IISESTRDKGRVQSVMEKERRKSQRISTDIELQLIYRERSFFFIAGDISSEGINIKSKSLTIPPGNLVDLILPVGEHEWQISGLVIHGSKGNTGIQFRMSQPELEAILTSRGTTLTAAPSITQERSDIPSMNR
ncbi:MAG: PilZ domain-containing protein, partial [Candidatus Sedimenticola sp. (ex Thyasira tokunagai)]